ncbi:hypothetical protein IWQ62_005792, partial [Dispira parvispora]
MAHYGWVPLDAGVNLLLNTEAHQRTVCFTIDPQVSSMLLTSLGGGRAGGHPTTHEMLLAALIRALQQWCHSSMFTIDLESHGRHPWRDDVDLARTIGWFTALYPATLTAPDGPKPSDYIRHAMASIRSVAHHGLPASYRNIQDRERLGGEYRPSDLAFNFLGHTIDDGAMDANGTAPWHARQDLLDHVSDVDPRELRPHLLEMACLVLQGCMKVELVYCPQVLASSKVHQLAELYRTSLEWVANYQQAHTSTRYWVPSDLPLLTTELSDMEPLEAKIRALPFDETAVQAIYPCTPLQSGLLAVTARHPSEYTIQLAFTVQGRVEVSQLRVAISKVVERHPILRTAFSLDGFGSCTIPVQFAIRDAHFQWQQGETWSDVNARDEEDFVEQDRALGFSLREPLLRICCIGKKDSGRLRCVLSSHHAILDGWSYGLLLKEVKSYLNSPNPVLPEAAPYHSFVEHIYHQDVQQAVQFWREYLLDCPPETVVRLPCDSAVPGLSSNGEHFVNLSENVESLEGVLHARGMTMSSLLRSAWAVLLMVYTGEQDVVFGTTVAGRSIPVNTIEEMVGFCINTIPTRVKLGSPQTTLGQLMKQVAADAAKLTGYEHSSLTDIQKWVHPDEARRQLFNTIMVYENYPHEELNSTSDMIQIFEQTAYEYTEYPLAGCFYHEGTNLRVRLTWKPAQFGQAYIESIGRNLDRIVQKLVAVVDSPTDSDCVVNALTFIHPDELETLDKMGCPAVNMNDSGSTVVDYFTAQVAKHPDVCAIRNGKISLTYKDLYDQALDLAVYLQSNQGLPRQAVV